MPGSIFLSKCVNSVEWTGGDNLTMEKILASVPNLWGHYWLCTAVFVVGLHSAFGSLYYHGYCSRILDKFPNFLFAPSGDIKHPTNLVLCVAWAPGSKYQPLHMCACLCSAVKKSNYIIQFDTVLFSTAQSFDQGVTLNWWLPITSKQIPWYIK